MGFMDALGANTLATATGPHLFWITSRAAGTAALILSSVSVCIGLLMGGRLLRGRRIEMRAAHEALSLATLATLLVHGLSLLGDGYLRPGVADVAVPFMSAYKTAWTAAGIVAFWMLAALGVSYYARGLIGHQRWRRLHRFTALAWMLGLVHALGEGSDAGQAWFLAMTALAAGPALGLLALRLVGSRLRTALGSAGAGELGRRAAPARSAASQAS